MKGRAYLDRRMRGKRGEVGDLAEALDMTPGAVGHALARMKHDGYPVVIEQHPLSGTIYSLDYGKRVCAEPGCGTILARDNPGDRCSIHKLPEDLPQDWFTTSNHPLPHPPSDEPEVKTCPQCGDPLPLESFYVQKRKYGQTHSVRCKACTSKRTKRNRLLREQA